MITTIASQASQFYQALGLKKILTEIYLRMSVLLLTHSMSFSEFRNTQMLNFLITINSDSSWNIEFRNVFNSVLHIKSNQCIRWRGYKFDRKVLDFINMGAQIVFWFPSNRWIIVDQTKRTSVLYHNSLTWLDWARWASLCNLVLTWTFLESNNTFFNNCLFIVISEIFFTLLASMGIRSEIDLNTALQVSSGHWSDKNLWVWNCPSRNFLFIDSYRIDVPNLNLYDAKKKS